MVLPYVSTAKLSKSADGPDELSLAARTSATALAKRVGPRCLSAFRGDRGKSIKRPT